MEDYSTINPYTSIYVKDVPWFCTATMLFDRFAFAHPVSINICRDMITKQSLGCAYIDFHRQADAERALQTMNLNVRKAPHHPTAPNAGGVPAAAAATVAQPAVNIQDQTLLTPSMLASALLLKQKQMLGVRLLPIIREIHPKLAGKITVMLLEMENSDLLHMLDDMNSLKAKVAEAVAVLQFAWKDRQLVAAVVADN